MVSYDAHEERFIQLPDGVNPKTLPILDQLQLPRQVEERHVDLVATKDGHFSTIITMKKETSRPEWMRAIGKIVVDINGMKTTAQDGSIIGNLRRNTAQKAEYSALEREQIQKDLYLPPIFVPITQGDSLQLTANGYNVSRSSKNNVWVISKNNRTIIYDFLNKTIETIDFDAVTLSKKLSVKDYYTTNSKGIIIPKATVETKYMQLSNGTCAESITETSFSNYETVGIAKNTPNIGLVQNRQKNNAPTTQIYPNPVFDNLTIIIPISQKVERIFIVDLLGKVVENYTISNYQNSYNANIQRLPKGTYFVNIQQLDKNIETLRFVKQ